MGLPVLLLDPERVGSRLELPPNARRPSLTPEARRWISDAAYFHWLDEGSPDGEDKRHWYDAEKAYGSSLMSRRTSKPQQQTLDLARFKNLLPVFSGGQEPSVEDVVLTILAACADPNSLFETALEQLERLHNLIADIVGQDTVDDSFQTLKVWRHELNEGAKAAKLLEALRRVTEDDPPEDTGQGGFEVSKDAENLMQEANGAFQKELPELSRTCSGKWVAYRGTQRIGIKDSKLELLQWCYAQGFPDKELFVARVQPEMPRAYATW